MLEKYKPAVDKENSFGALLPDLSKTFDCFSRELLFAKVDAYGFCISALRFIHCYLANRRQRTIQFIISSQVQFIIQLLGRNFILMYQGAS